MGCICSKGTEANDYVETQTEKEFNKTADPTNPLVVPLRKEENAHIVEVNVRIGGAGSASVRVSVPTPQLVQPSQSVPPPQASTTLTAPSIVEKDEDSQNDGKSRNGSKTQHQRRATVDAGAGIHRSMSRNVSMPRSSEAEQVVAGWPTWLTSVAGDAIKGWLPRRADSFEKLDKIGQGTYSNVYRARDLDTGKIVALKKVRFVNMDPESVRFMAREIYILRKLDHPNVVKLEGIITSRMSGSLYLIFEYMEHDLAGLAASRSIKFSEPQIKCYLQQLFRGLEHCHSRGVLHRDIKGSNLLIDNNGNLKIGDFGLATFFNPNQKQQLTSRVVTLWYRPPELLLGATEYGVVVDLWSAGCILAELLAGKPIMAGRTEVEQMHKIFKLCGSPSEQYWRRSKLPHATIFKPQHPYKRCIAETFKDFPPSALALLDKLLSIEPESRGTTASALNSDFFNTDPLPCDPSSLPKYSPTKELDAKMQEEEARRQKAALKSESKKVTDSKAGPAPDAKELQKNRQHTQSEKYSHEEDGGSGFLIEPPRMNEHPGTSKKSELRMQRSYLQQGSAGLSAHASLASRSSARLDFPMSVHAKWPEKPGNAGFNQLDDAEPPENKEWLLDKSISTHKKVEKGYANKKRIHYSGPLVPPGGNLEDMLKEHERQIQAAVRKARLEKVKTKKNMDHSIQSESLLHSGRKVR